jgi:hypothetical protein
VKSVSDRVRIAILPRTILKIIANDKVFAS